MKSPQASIVCGFCVDSAHFVQIGSKAFDNGFWRKDFRAYTKAEEPCEKLIADIYGQGHGKGLFIDFSVSDIFVTCS